MIIPAMLILTILAVASFSAGGYYVLQQYLQQQTADHEIFAKEGLQKHLAYCHDRFSGLANGVLSNYRHINTTCTDILNPALIKQMIVSGIPPTVKTHVQGAHAYRDGVSFGISDSGRVPHVKQVSVFCMPVRLPSLVWYQWCIW